MTTISRMILKEIAITTTTVVRLLLPRLESAMDKALNRPPCTTKRQIRRLVRRQALMLSAVGIPLGLAAGYGIGALVLPFPPAGLHLYLPDAPFPSSENPRL